MLNIPIAINGNQYIAVSYRYIRDHAFKCIACIGLNGIIYTNLSDFGSGIENPYLNDAIRTHPNTLIKALEYCLVNRISLDQWRPEMSA